MTDDFEDARALAVLEEMRRSKAIVPPTLRESFTVRYVIALVIVAMLSLGAGYSGIRLINAQADAAAEVNVSGRQRMLSQRIAFNSTMFTDATGRDRDSIARALRADSRAMANAQSALLTGDAALGIHGPPGDAVRALFAAGIADDVDDYLTSVATLLASSRGSTSETTALRSIQTAANGLMLEQLDSVVSAYQADSEARIDQIEQEEKLIVAATLVALLLEALFVFRPMSRRIATETRRLEAAAARHQAEAKRHAFGIQLRDAVEFADSEDDLAHTVRTAHEVSLVPGDFQFIRTDPSAPAAMLPLAPGRQLKPHDCSVKTPDGCPAMRRGQTLTFADPEGLGSCRQFRADSRAAGAVDVASTCVPVTFRGAGIGVIRSIRPKDTVLDDHEVDALATIALTAGTHIGTLRAFAASRADAEHDALTGLLNRRGIEAGVERLAAGGERYVVAIADLDGFKAVNDAHGHDVGDTTLEETAQIMHSVLRPDDLLGRHGGEEFVVIIPLGSGGSSDGDLAAGVAVAERIRVALENAQTTSRSPLCTVSIGVGASGLGLESAVQQADQALYRAKALGRNRVEVEGDLLSGLDDVLTPTVSSGPEAPGATEMIASAEPTAE